ncbi:MAG: UDP-N-acetylglucosamine--N-acetylmuramyl-(pentapeptide) pyrophosphoryl-undecaprenol N-acetylglucosamine transferase [Oscillospiraceae bacterium]|nr:UDP-N-acetylglucosamine--N-acetylmuramyl-(pentapeptide) pyrophosphoryl-undecaprenol N-acetylglucosamine transferase [Oscillospiraceae bacterium]
MRFILAAGGTAGHINPALAIAAEIKRRDPEAEIRFVGRPDGMEGRLVPEKGYVLLPVETTGFTRGRSVKAIEENIVAVKKALTSVHACRKYYSEFKPDFVIGCGGYVSGPAVITAARMGIHTAIHEQNSFPGITTKMLSKRVEMIFAPSEEALERIGYPEKTTVVGNPINEAFFTTDREEAREKLGVGDRVCIVSFGGSNGAKTINELAAKVMQKTCGTGRTFHIHATGPYWLELFPNRMKEYGIQPDNPNIDVRTYISNMADCLAAADLVIARSGANAICEIAASGSASVLIPSPNVTENHQYYNALVLGNADAAIVCEEKDLDIDELAGRIANLTDQPEKLKQMGINAKSKAYRDSAKIIGEKIFRILEKR